MVDRKPSDSRIMEGAFPWDDFWERIDGNWETVDVDPEGHAKKELTFRRAFWPDVPDNLFVERTQIEILLEPLRLEAPTRTDLARRLYGLGNVFIGRAHRRAAGSDSEGSLKALADLATAAAAFEAALVALPPQPAGMLVVSNYIVSNLVDGRGFDILTLLRGSHDIQLAIEGITDGASSRGRGRTVDKLLNQWVWLATTAIEEATGQTVRAKQFHGDSREPRVEGAKGDVLRAYLHLGFPNLSDRTIVRIIVRHRRELKRKHAP